VIGVGPETESTVVVCGISFSVAVEGLDIFERSVVGELLSPFEDGSEFVGSIEISVTDVFEGSAVGKVLSPFEGGSEFVRSIKKSVPDMF
jgi:hypothetical protein